MPAGTGSGRLPRPRRAGWQWQRTRRTDPVRAGRHWLMLAVATLLAVAHGTRRKAAATLGRNPARLRSPRATGPSRSAPHRPASCARAWPAWAPCWPGGGGGRGSGCDPGPAPTGRRPSAPWPGDPDAQPRLRYAQNPSHQPRGHTPRGQVGASSTPSPTERTAVRAACGPTARPRNAVHQRPGRPVADIYLPHPEPHIYLSRVRPPVRPGLNHPPAQGCQHAAAGDGHDGQPARRSRHHLPHSGAGQGRRHAHRVRPHRRRLPSHLRGEGRPHPRLLGTRPLRTVSAPDRPLRRRQRRACPLLCPASRPRSRRLNQKGGVGKSTLAVHVAWQLVTGGADVLLLDADVQASASNWTALREESPFVSLPCPRADLHHQVAGLTDRPAVTPS